MGSAKCRHNNEFIQCFFNDENTGWIGGDGGLYSTTNGGSTWMQQLSIPSFYFIYFINSTTGWADARYGYVYKTTNAGSLWNLQNSTSGSTFYTLKFFDANTGWAIGDYSAIIKTTNGGQNWLSQETQIQGNNEWLRSGSFINVNTGWAIGYNGMVLKTTNSGNPLGIEKLGNEVPNEFKLFQNYPNPFNPNSKIKFNISKASFSKLSVYDAIGREVGVLVNEQLKPGTYEVDWNAGNYPSGVYFYKLQTEDYTETKKMSLVK